MSTENPEDSKTMPDNSDSVVLNNPFIKSSKTAPIGTKSPESYESPKNELPPPNSQESLHNAPELQQTLDGLHKEISEIPTFHKEVPDQPGTPSITAKRGSIWDRIPFWNAESNPQEPATATVTEDTEAINRELKSDGSLLWVIPTQVTKLSGLLVNNGSNDNKKTQSTISETVEEVSEEVFLPNTLSRIRNNNNEIVAVQETDNKDDSISSLTNAQQEEGNSWLPWNWGTKVQAKVLQVAETEESANPAGTAIVDGAEESKLYGMLLSNAIQCLSYGIEKPCSWGMYKKNNEELGEVVLTGNKTCKNGTFMKSLPKTNFETQEGLMKTLGRDEDLPGITSPSEAVVLPDLKWNYRALTFKTSTRIFLSNFIPFTKPQQHLYTIKELKPTSKREVKKAIVISVHGFLPQKVSKNIINEPSGSANVMKEYMNKELQRWSAINKIDLDIDNIVIEGYGKLFEKLHDSISILEHWSKELKEADYLIVVSNSHSVTLGIHILAKLLNLSLVDDTKKIGFLGISGLALGPIASLEGKISSRGGSAQENEMISELFDFEEPESLQSKELVRSFKVIVKANCKISFASSIMDCFTPLYSTMALQFNHPNIFRMVYIDSLVELPDFIVSLLNFILSIKNLNHSDHGLLLEISKYFEGKVQSGKHGGILKDKHVYRNAVNNILGTNDLVYGARLDIWPKNIRELIVNNYHIPWCLRGALEEMGKLRSNWDVDQMMDQLIQEFNNWDPSGNPELVEFRHCIEAFGTIKASDIGL